MVALRRLGPLVPGGVLGRKIVRDLWNRKVSLAILVFIVTVGIGTLIAFNSVYRDLHGATHDYFRDRRLGDFIVDLRRAPESALALLRTLPNVEEAQGRVSIPALLEIPNLTEPIGGLALSLPEKRRPILNDVLLRRGSWFSGRDEREAILTDAFATANGLGPGDRIKIMLLDRQHEVLVVGTAISPEFIYLIPADGGIAPDPARFGVVYLPEDFLQGSAELEGAFNQIVGRTHDDDPEELARTFQIVQERLDPWGVANVSSMDDQASVRFIKDELRGLRASSKITPSIFLVVAVLVMNVLMNRMVVQQRTVVGTLKALGRSTFAVTLHYMCYGVFVGVLGGFGGLAFSLWTQGGLISIYRQFYTLPDLRSNLHPDLIAIGFAASIVFACAGTVQGVMHAARLQPADAMRPPPPERGGRIFVERFAALWARLSFRWRLVLRAIFRNPFRSGVAVFTSAISMALIVQTFCMMSALDYLMDYQFSKLMHQDMTVAVRDPLGYTAAGELRDIPGVAAVEPQLGIVCDLSNGARRKRTAVTGLPPDNRLFTPLDDAGDPIRPPPEGLVLSDKLARILGVGVGDTIAMRPLLGRRDRVEAPVVGVATTFLGVSAYADIRYLSRLLGEEWVANALLNETFGEGPQDAIYDELKTRPTVVGVSRRTRAFEQMQGTFGETQGAMLSLLIGFAGMIAFGSVLNNAFVSLSEREREVGIFRVVGYSPGEVAAILRGELVLLASVGIFVGIFLGILMVRLISKAYDTELYRFPVVIPPAGVARSVLIMAGFVAAAQIVVRRMIGRIDWLEAVKIKE